MSKRENTAYKLSDTFNINTPISSHSIIGLGTLKVNFIIYSIEDTDGNKAFIHQRWKYKMAQCGDRSNQFYLFKSKVHIPFDPVIPLLRIYPDEIMRRLDRVIVIRRLTVFFNNHSKKKPRKQQWGNMFSKCRGFSTQDIRLPLKMTII